MRMLVPTLYRKSWPTRNFTADLESSFTRDPFEDFDRIVDSFIRPQSMSSVNFQTGADFNEAENHYMLSFDLPGVKKEDLKIEMRGNQLLVAGERRNDSRSSRTYGKFERSFTLPESVNAEKIEAQFEDGVLSIALPKAEEAKAKTIEIQSGSTGFFNKLLGTKKESSKDIKVS